MQAYTSSIILAPEEVRGYLRAWFRIGTKSPLCVIAGSTWLKSHSDAMKETQCKVLLRWIAGRQKIYTDTCHTIRAYKLKVRSVALIFRIRDLAILLLLLGSL